jgi:hypothetical protein
MSSLERVDRVVAGMLPIAVMARLGVPTLAVAAFLVVLSLGVACWVISSSERSDRVARMIYARRGDIRYLDKNAVAFPSAAAQVSRRHKGG